MTAESGEAALANADRYDTYDVGMCLKWVRTDWEIGSLYASAIDAWNGAYKKHPGDRNPPTGAPCFYRGGTYGHIVIARRHDSARMRSTDCQSAGQVNDESIGWPEYAWGDTYLGWTEDLNGVDLPIGAQPEEDDMPEYAHAKHNAKVNLKADTWYPIDWGDPRSGAKWFDDDGGPGIHVGGNRYSATLAVDVARPDGGTVQTSWVEMEDAEAVETSEIASHGEIANAVDTRNGAVKKGRRLRARVRVTNHNAVLQGADVALLIFKAD